MILMGILGENVVDFFVVVFGLMPTEKIGDCPSGPYR
jgi:hypothetical protein